MARIPKADLDAISNLVGDPKAMSGAYDAATRFDRQIAGWSPPLHSADRDLIPAKGTIDARSRDMGRNDAYVQSGETIHKDGIVGAMYMLNARPAHKALGLDEVWATEFQEEVETLFTLYAESPMKWVDAARQLDFTSMIRLGVGISVFSGECLATAEWKRERGREFSTAIQMIDPDRLATPPTLAYNDNVRAGIRLDNDGAPISAFIRTSHPSDYSMTGVGMDRFKETAFYKPWGRQQVIFLREQRRAAQTRAIADIAAGLREIAITKKFRDVTLQKAVLAASFGATITSELPADVIYNQLGTPGAGQQSLGAAVTDYATQYLQALNAYSGASKNMLLDGVKIPHLFPGTKFEMQRAGDPVGVGQDFEASLLRYIAAALNVSYEELSKDFSKTNYSSARAAMAHTGKFMSARKKVVADALATSVYRLWLEEAIDRGVLTTVDRRLARQLYANGYLGLRFDAIARCQWIGAAKSQIDELKETQAAVLRIKYGLSTHEDELSRLGKDWRVVYAQLERERIMRDDKGIVLFEDNSVNAASGTTREDRQEGTEAGDDPEAE